MSSFAQFGSRVAEMTPAPVVIVGGGIAGLAAAYELHTKRRAVRPARGRRRAPAASSSAKQVDGFTIDGGPDSLLIQKPEAIALCEELGLGDRGSSRPSCRALAYIQRGGRLHPLPAASVLGIPTRIGAVRPDAPVLVARQDCGWARSSSSAAKREAGDESIGAFIERRFGARRRPISPSRCSAGIHAGRRRSAVDRRAVSALRRRRATARQPAARVPSKPARAARRRTARSSRCPAA